MKRSITQIKDTEQSKKLREEQAKGRKERKKESTSG
jgi:hypothetical protein